MPLDLDHIIKAFEQELPGPDVQFQMAPIGRGGKEPPKNAKIAAVLCLLYFQSERWYIVFIERSSKNTNDRHSGQISFPGGMLEPGDESLQECALREAEEEIGLDISAVQVLSALSPLYIPVSNFMVHPFVAYTRELQHFERQASEVASIHLIPLAELLNLANIDTSEVLIQSLGKYIEVPSFSLDKAMIWGATAMMLHECLTILRNSMHQE